MEDRMAVARRARKKKISPFNQSPFKADYIRLIEAGWSSTSLERYAAYRYKEDIPASTFRNHMGRYKKPETPAVIGKTDQDLTGQDVDVMGIRHALVNLQLQRLQVDVKHEFQMNKLFSSTREELKLLGQLLNEVKADQKDYGVLKEGTHEETPASGPKPVVPRAESLGALLGLDPAQDQVGLAEALAQVIPLRNGTV